MIQIIGNKVILHENSAIGKRCAFEISRTDVFDSGESCFIMSSNSETTSVKESFDDILQALSDYENLGYVVDRNAKPPEVGPQ